MAATYHGGPGHLRDTSTIAARAQHASGDTSTIAARAHDASGGTATLTLALVLSR
jgi:hypothetical protein